MIKFSILTAALIAMFVANVFFGAVSIAPEDVIGAFTGNLDNDALSFIILNNRVPQAVTATLAGAGLSICGLLLQTVFRNPLAGPSILGISSGASLGVALVMLFLGGFLSLGSYTWGGYAAVVVGALAGSLLIMGILISISTVVGNHLMLLITGIMVGYLTSSVVTLLSSLSTAQGLQTYVMWGMGNFGDVSTRQMPFFSVLTVLSLLVACLLAKPLNLLTLGDSYAINLGLNIKRIRIILLLVTGILTAVITAYCGPITFIGMAVPHISRMIFRTDDHRILIPATMISGSLLCLACNVVSTMPQDIVIPINALTPVAGVPVILYVILHHRH